MSTFRKILGPYEILDTVSPNDTIPIAEFPYSRVQGGNMSCSVQENLSIAQGGTFFSMTAMFEVEIVGKIQGATDTLKRGWLCGLSGPLKKAFETWDVYETIEVRVRNMVGGKSGGNIIGGNPASTLSLSTQRGFFARLTINVQPRGSTVTKPEPPKVEPY